jgi:hypothetical protein
MRNAIALIILSPMLLFAFKSFYGKNSFFQTNMQNIDFEIADHTPLSPQKAFSCASLDALDCESGNYVHQPESHRNFYNKKYIKAVIINRLFSDGRIEEMIVNDAYKNGLKISSNSSLDDTGKTDEYKYDELGRLISLGADWKYEYASIDNTIEANSRNVYYKSNLSRIENIEIDNNGYRAITIMTDGLIYTVTYFKENNLIKSIIRERNGRERNWDYFEYENNYLKKLITSSNTKDDIRQIRTVNARENENILAMDIQNFRNGTLEFNENWNFYN